MSFHSTFDVDMFEFRKKIGCPMDKDDVPECYALYCPDEKKYIKSFTIGGPIDNECHIDFTDKIEEAETMIVSKNDFKNQCVNEFVKIELVEVR